MQISSSPLVDTRVAPQHSCACSIAITLAVLQQTLSLREPSRPALTVMGRLSLLSASGLSCRFLNTTSPARTEMRSASASSPATYLPKYACR